MLRRLMLWLAENKSVDHFVRTRGMSRGFARRFVAGGDLQDAIEAVRRLNADGVLASLDFLGERVIEASEARLAAQYYLGILEAIDQAAVRCDISLKLTQLGLDIDASIAEENMRQILGRARQLANFVRIDMENSPYIDRTLEMYRRLHAEFGDCVGLVIQSYLRRSAADVERLLPLRPNIRLCKGAYRESPEISFPDKVDVDRNFVKLMQELLLRAGYTAIATHDERVIAQARNFIEENNIARDRFEFEMLYGIRRDLQLSMARQGYRVRVYVPFGRQWYPYFMRRMAERPANIWFVVKSLIREGAGG